MNDNCDDHSTIGDDDVSVSDMNDDDNGAGGSSKSNSITSEHSMQSTGISASSQGSSTNSLPKGVPIPHQGGSGQHAGGGGSGGVAALSLGGASAGGHHPAASSGGPNADPNATSSQSQIDAAVYGQHGGGNSSGGHQQHHHYSNTPTSFHRPTLAQAQGGPSPSLSAKSKLSQQNPRKLMPPGAPSGLTTDNYGTIDPKNFATIRTTSIVQREQKEHLHEDMHDQMSGYKRLRRDHQAALSRLEEQCRQEMEKHKQMLDREYEQLLTQFSRELERLQLKHQEELEKRLKNNINTEKKLIKEVSEQHVLERKSFESKMKQEYKLKKERWKREMAEVDTPKRQREAVLSQHKENFKEIDATENQRLARNQKEVLDREVRKFRRRRLVKYHELEQDLLREELNKRQSQLESAHTMLMRHHEQTHELESKQQRSVHHIREDHLNRQHSTELSNQEEYMKRAQRELKKKHALEIKQQPKSLKQKELMIRKQFRDTCKIQTRQYKALKAQVLQSTSKEEQKTIIRKLKEEQRRKMALLGEQYEQTIADMLQKQSIRMDETQEREATTLAERLQHELEILTAYQSKSKMAGESQRSRERQELEERVHVRRTLLEQKMDEETQQFLQERSERIRLLHERQAREIEQFDDESTRLGFSAMSIAESSKLPGYGEENTNGSVSSFTLSLSNSATSFSSGTGTSTGASSRNSSFTQRAGHHPM